jgi:hypothetical protein
MRSVRHRRELIVRAKPVASRYLTCPTRACASTVKYEVGHLRHVKAHELGRRLRDAENVTGGQDHVSHSAARLRLVH